MISRKIVFLGLLFLFTGNLYSYPTNIIVTGNDDGSIRYFHLKEDGSIGIKNGFVDDIGDNAWGVGSEDFNKDGYPDIVSGSPNDGKIYLYSNQGTNLGGYFIFNKITVASNLDLNGYILDFCVADFNGDGYADFVCSGNTTTNMVFINNQNNSFSMQYLQPTTYYLRGKDVGDFD